MGFSRQESWSGLSFPSPGDLPNPGIEFASPALQADRLLIISATKEVGKVYLAVFIEPFYTPKALSVFIYMCDVCLCKHYMCIYPFQFQPQNHI